MFLSSQLLQIVKKRLCEFSIEHGSIGAETRVKFADGHKKMKVVIFIDKLVISQEKKIIIRKKVCERKGGISWTRILHVVINHLLANLQKGSTVSTVENTAISQEDPYAIKTIEFAENGSRKLAFSCQSKQELFAKNIPFSDYFSLPSFRPVVFDS